MPWSVYIVGGEFLFMLGFLLWWERFTRIDPNDAPPRYWHWRE